MMTYLVNQYAPNNAIYPTDPKKRAQIDRVLYYEGTTLNPALKSLLISQWKEKKFSPEILKELNDAIDNLVKVKGNNKFIAGSQATLADISLAMSWDHLNFSKSEHLKPLEQWYKDVQIAIPAVKEINDSLDFSPLKKVLEG